jgi:hypothetical protein
MRSLAIALTLALLAAPAFAQGLSGPEHRHAGPGYGPPKEPPKVKVDEKEYRRAIDSIADKKVVSDPWQGVRAGEGAKVENKAK